MTARLDDLPSIETMLHDEATTPQTIMGKLLYAMPHTLLADSPLGFQCRCDSVRLALASLATLQHHEVMEMVNERQGGRCRATTAARSIASKPSSSAGVLSAS